MLLTRDQQFFLSILRETGYMRRDQVLPLLRLHDPAKEERHCEAILRHLRYAGELIPLGGELVCLPEYRETEPDKDMLWALDILLALASGPPLQITGRKPPYKLCFLLAREDGRLDSFAVMPVEPGREQITCVLLSQQTWDVTLLLALCHLEQHRLLKVNQRHYFVVRQDGRPRFFKGGEAPR